ncbi:MAG: histidine kinase [Ferruginibacter sp.]|nr:histidine kinase [Ferruginibacter sp.]
MKWYTPPKWKLRSFLLAMPLICLAMNVIMFEDQLWSNRMVWWVSFPLIFVIGFAAWYIFILQADATQKKYPGLNQSRQRIIHKILVQVLILIAGLLLTFFVYAYFNIAGYQWQNNHVAKGFALGLFINLIFQTLYEAEYMLGRYKAGVEENEAIQQLSEEQAYDTLKSHVNPHFLFNCFNTLSSLIAEDRQRADAFLSELSKVYRYLLRSNEDGISTLANEMLFINSYYRLLQTRHGEAVQLNIQIDKRYEHYLLPSLTLQLLVENVVKHNALSKNKPLLIDIFTTAGNKLIVNNNLQPRSIKAPSNKVGLDNIKAKYELLKRPGFQVMEDEKNFTVVLPLIWNGNREHKELINRKMQSGNI